MSIHIQPVTTKTDLKSFLHFPHEIYSNDPHWVAPLHLERRQFLNPKKNPFFKTGEAALFLAMDGEKVCGRISAHIHHDHLKRYQDDTGFFGFFESIPDPKVSNALIEAACVWLRNKKMKKIRGPLSFTINDEAGLLVDGFDSPPFVMMTHNPPYYGGLLETTGLKKTKDLYAWHYQIGELPEQAIQLAEATRKYPGLEIRSIEMKNYEEEISLMMEIFNEAWNENWSFVPMTKREIQHVAKSLKPIIDPHLAFFVFVDSKPAAMSICIPNMNEALMGLRGELFPFGWLRLLCRLKQGLKSARLCLMGIKKPFRGSKIGALSVLMNVEMQQRGKVRGYKTAELSWTLEDNEKINMGIAFMGGRHYKTYRIYEKEL